MREVEMVTIERVGRHWRAILWAHSDEQRPIRLASAAGASDQQALIKARGMLKRKAERDAT